jgi:hypothetical protein
VRAILPSQVRNFDLSLGQAVSGQITKVLNSSSIRRHHQGLEVDNRYGNPVQQAVARPDTESAAGRSSTSTPGGESRGLKGLLETFIKSRASRLPEDTRQDGNSISFPSAMSFCFSSTGQAILAWQKGEKFLVRMVISPRSDRDGRGLDIDQIISDTAPDGPVKIQYAAEGDGIIAIVAFRGSNGLELALLHESGVLASENSYLRLDETSCAPTCMSISPDNAFVAIGFGQQLFLAYFDGRLIHKIPPVPVPGTSDKSVRFQVCSFSAGSDWLILSTQSQHHTQVSREDDTVETCAWQTGLRTLRPRILSKCHMPTVGNIPDISIPRQAY